jgi:aminoglycoside phosphotransferase (APT) family kinase protein
MSELADALGGLLGGEVSELRHLTGGASHETWSFDLRRPRGPLEPLILRRALPGVPGATMGLEARLLQAAAGAGVPVPHVIAASDDPGVLGDGYIVMERVEGETLARRILRDDAHRSVRPRLVAQCGEALARLHSIDPATVGGLEDQDQLGHWRQMLDDLGQPHPAFELALRWLEANRPPPGPPAVVHGDFRLGNLIIGTEGLASVLDWELAHRGDGLEDLGWLCVRSWRFGSPHPVAGLGSYDELMSAYRAAGGAPVDRARLHWWETLGTLKWGVVCILQANRHLSGAVRSVELAAIGRRVCENEWDVLTCLGRAAEPARG